MDIGGTAAPPAVAPAAGGAGDLLGGGLDQLIGGAAVGGDTAAPSVANTNNLLGDIFGMGTSTVTGYVPPKQVWLSAQKGKGLEISGTWCLKNNVIHMEMSFSNKAMQAMSGFGIQLNKNSFGLVATQPLNIPMLNAGQTLDISLPMNTTGPVQKMDPLTNIQVAIKSTVDIFYFACIAPLHIFFSEDGAMEKKTFLNTWKDIPAANEIQYTMENVECTSDGISTKMSQNNAFTVAKRTLEGQDMIYQSLKLTNGIWGLVEIKLAPGNPSVTLSFKSRVMEIAQAVFQVYDAILHN
jgi:AP-1 complex subunit beta-1